MKSGLLPHPIPMLFMIYVLNGTARHSEEASSTKCPTWGSTTQHFPSLLYISKVSTGLALSTRSHFVLVEEGSTKWKLSFF